ncbi:glutamate-gated kainate-type ion channel receptor subunit GluR5 [Corchorus capsularis]|uniref:Glutamate-gated kainate-type ion channel receptor subunit GluR5 n=1 Tax=Corchorus capsularis TaxID=210143 RepID=A0A1R3HSJ3_COCAP|nr:glutamate-gated kainate-type ion channel receptor subunit GluR5 [Corchorus capsularis]
MSAATILAKQSLKLVKESSWRPFLIIINIQQSNMSGSWRHKLLLFSLLTFILLSEASRLPKAYFEQMLPKKLPTPSSSPSKGTNSLTTSTSKAVKTDTSHLSSDGKV